MVNPNADRNKQVIAMYQEGATYHQFAQYLGVDHDRARGIVAGIVSRAGVATRRAAKALKPDIVGKVFGELTVIADVGRDRNHHRVVRVRCSCGREKVVQRHNIENGKSRSCFHKEDGL